MPARRGRCGAGQEATTASRHTHEARPAGQGQGSAVAWGARDAPGLRSAAAGRPTRRWARAAARAARPAACPRERPRPQPPPPPRPRGRGPPLPPPGRPWPAARRPAPPAARPARVCTPPPRAAGTPAGALARGPLTPPVPCSLGCARCQCCRVRVVRQVPGSQWGLQACTANDGRAPAPVRTQASRPGQTLHLPEPAQAQTAVLGRGARAPAAAGAARLGLQQPAAGRGGVVRPPARRRGWRRVAGVAIPVGVRGRSRRGASAGVPGGGGAAGILADELRRRRHGRDDGRRRRRVDVLRACTRRGPQAESAPLRSGRPNPAPCRPTLGASRTRQALRGPGHRAARRRGAHRTSGSGMHGHAGAR